MHSTIPVLAYFVQGMKEIFECLTFFVPALALWLVLGNKMLAL
jgi:hypothetical protein